MRSNGSHTIKLKSQQNNLAFDNYSKNENVMS